MTDCDRKGKLIGGCRFVPADDEKPSPYGEVKVSFDGGRYDGQAGTLRSVMVLKDYAGALCQTCGKQVKP